ncbi:MAG: NahK/ErcS family hybrid sensor histidine kinase/response regulator, partial [Oceanococcaceae bacterium]
FHLLTVESGGTRDLRVARWVLPVFLIIISAFVWPLAARGLAVLGPQVDADTYVLQLPMAAGQNGMAVLAFIGGFSAATAMVIVSSVALAIMVSNGWVMPRLLSNSRWVDRHDLGRAVVNVRRLAIVGLLTASYLFYHSLAVKSSLATIGMVSFVGIAQLAPALFAALYWRGMNRSGVLSGLLAGLVAWLYTLLIPAFFAGQPWLTSGPGGVAGLAPYRLLGVEGLNPVVHATLWSLALNVLTMVLVSRVTRTPLAEHLDTQRFESPLDRPGGRIRVADLRVVIERFYGADRAHSWLTEFVADGNPLEEGGYASSRLVAFIEQRLAAAMGASSARSLLGALHSGSTDIVREVARAIEQASGVARFNRDLLQATLDSLSQAVSVVDAEQRLVAWNHAYERLFQLPAELLAEGESIERILRFNAARGWLGEGDPEQAVQRRLAHLRSHRSHRHERRMPDGTVLEVRGEPMPGGGFVTTFTDVTDFIRVQRELERANLTLEQRVRQRTQALEDANQALQVARGAAETANRSKTRFLAAAGHDLMQPLNAARLFVASVVQHPQRVPDEIRQPLEHAEQSLHSMEALLSDLLDISRLDAGIWEAHTQPVRLDEVLEILRREGQMLAATKGIRLRVHSSRAVVDSDPVLLRRILQNFLGNALRYTARGRVVLGVRRQGDAVRIEVWDTGPGINPADQEHIFEEFARLPTAAASPERGFGLGLAICIRMARLLNHRIHVRSTPGRGSCFSLEVQRSRSLARDRAAQGPVAHRPASRLRGLRVLCIDNEPQVLEGMRALLESWGCVVSAAEDATQAEQQARQLPPQVILADYQLDGGVVGVDVVLQLRTLDALADVPALLLTAENTAASRAAAAQAGMRVLLKPVKPAALRALLSRFIS